MRTPEEVEDLAYQICDDLKDGDMVDTIKISKRYKLSGSARKHLFKHIFEIMEKNEMTLFRLPRSMNNKDKSQYIVVRFKRILVLYNLRYSGYLPEEEAKQPKDYN